MPDKPLDDVWVKRDFPVLVEVTRRIDAGERHVNTSDVAEALGMDRSDVELAGQALERRQLLKTMGTMQRRVLHMTDLSGEAYLLTGLHPDGNDALEQLISALRQAADHTSDPEEKGRLRKAASVLGDLVGDVGAGVMTAYLTGMLPGQ